MDNITNIVEDYKNKIGTVVGTSSWIKVDQNMINDFASITMDNQFIHISPERAAIETPFGSTIAHGFLILSLSTKFYNDALKSIPGEKMGINYGFDKIRFVSPVKCNDNIRGVFELQNVKRKSDKEILFSYKLTTEVLGKDKPALVCSWLSLSTF